MAGVMDNVMAYRPYINTHTSDILRDIRCRGMRGNGIPCGNGNREWESHWIEDSHRNGNENQMSVGMGMGTTSVGVGMLKNDLLKNWH